MQYSITTYLEDKLSDLKSQLKEKESEYNSLETSETTKEEYYIIDSGSSDDSSGSSSYIDEEKKKIYDRDYARMVYLRDIDIPKISGTISTVSQMYLFFSNLIITGLDSNDKEQLENLKNKTYIDLSLNAKSLADIGDNEYYLKLLSGAGCTAKAEISKLKAAIVITNNMIEGDK